MDETIENLQLLKRHLNSIEHMIYVSCKFTRTSEMLRRVMETIIGGYEQFFGVAYEFFSKNATEEFEGTIHHKIELLTEMLESKGFSIDLSDYFLLKRLLLSDFESVGEYRKNLCIISYVDGSEFVVDMNKLLNFYEKLKGACTNLNLALSNGQQKQAYMFN